MRKSISILSIVAALSFCFTSCVTFSTGNSPRYRIADLALTQLNVALAGPLTAVNLGIAGPDSTKFRTPGEDIEVTLNRDNGELGATSINSQHLKVSCVTRNAWIVTQNPVKKGTIYDDILYYTTIELLPDGYYKCVFTASENDQNGLTAIFNSKEDINVKIAPGNVCRFSIINPGFDAFGIAEFEYFYNNKTLDWCKAVFDDTNLRITTSQD